MPLRTDAVTRPSTHPVLRAPSRLDASARSRSRVDPLPRRSSHSARGTPSRTARRTSDVWPRMRSSSRRRRPGRPAATSSDRWRAVMTSLPAVTRMDQSISGVARGGPGAMPPIPEKLGWWGTEGLKLAAD